MAVHQVLIGGRWRPAKSSESFRTENPATREPLEEYPISSWEDCDEALSAAAMAFEQMKRLSGEHIAAFLDAFALRIEARKATVLTSSAAK